MHSIQHIAELLSLAVDKPDGTLPTSDRRLLKEILGHGSASFEFERPA